MADGVNAMDTDRAHYWLADAERRLRIVRDDIKAGRVQTTPKLAQSAASVAVLGEELTMLTGKVFDLT